MLARTTSRARSCSTSACRIRSGLAVLDRLKHDPRTRHIPVHVISAADYTRAALADGRRSATAQARRARAADGRDPQASRPSSPRSCAACSSSRTTRPMRESTCAAARGATTSRPWPSAPPPRRSSSCAPPRSTAWCSISSLPDRSGFELLEEMSRGEQYGFPPVIVYTGRSLSTRGGAARCERFSSSIIDQGRALARAPARRGHAVPAPGRGRAAAGAPAHAARRARTARPCSRAGAS